VVLTNTSKPTKNPPSAGFLLPVIPYSSLASPNICE
jgi:hypothetical protein